MSIEVGGGTSSAQLLTTARAFSRQSTGDLAPNAFHNVNKKSL